MLPANIVEKIVLKCNLGPDMEVCKNLKDESEKTETPLIELLLSKNLVDESSLFTKAGEILNVPFVSLKGRDIRRDILNLIPSPVANANNVVAFDKNEKEILLAMTDPTDLQTAEFIRRKTGLEPKIHITTFSDLKDALHRYHAGLEEEMKIIQENKDEEETGDLKKAAEELPIINIVSSILEHAVYEGASDIHIEPNEKELAIRYRIDGILKSVMSLPKNFQSGIVARIKILANLKIDEHMVPQDGRFKIQLQADKMAFRVSIIPVYDGEKIVMRLLPEGAKPLTLDQLGFLPSVKILVENAIKKPNGMILVTGPTGSGKTTTLYSVLGILNQPGVNISTIEDPIEYRIQGVNQSQINPKIGFTFASGLRAFLRQDPNIIMVGEIRDQETAEIAVHAAMTGHLVLSTLHTNDAPTTIPRLTDMGVPPFLVSYTTNIVMAQRLVRKICPYCKKEYKLDRASIDALLKAFDAERITTILKENNLLKEGEKNLEEMVFYKGEGCSRCNNSGHKGRVGIYEVMEVNQEIIHKINEHADSNALKDTARKNGMITMSEDGLIKAKMGVTTIAEILRVTKE
ncbi:MAG TPA: ATPase, T2SS/T4P/T4SS family [Candidatus Magasanikbacteria bacterium]|nr:ATPase, T2SS/T4P/T4SS family [Candidatus Magasanikbacteria bacterium]